MVAAVEWRGKAQTRSVCDNKPSERYLLPLAAIHAVLVLKSARATFTTPFLYVPVHNWHCPKIKGSEGHWPIATRKVPLCPNNTRGGVGEPRNCWPIKEVWAEKGAGTREGARNLQCAYDRAQSEPVQTRRRGEGCRIPTALSLCRSGRKWNKVIANARRWQLFFSRFFLYHRVRIARF